MRAGELEARIVPVATLDEGTMDAMWRLFQAHYDDTTRDVFERDLAEKRDVILARDGTDGSLQGFSTLTWVRRESRGRRFIAIFSGDTIIAPPYWGQKALQNAFGRYITRTMLAHPFTPVYWFLVSKGYKTYLLLTRNFPEHWPRHDKPMPAWHRAALDALARERFGDAWDPAAGVVRAHAGSGRLREGIAPVDAALLTRPDVRFFHEANPHHARGDELACLGRVSLAVWGGYLAKQLRRRRRAATGGAPWAAS